MPYYKICDCLNSKVETSGLRKGLTTRGDKKRMW